MRTLSSTGSTRKVSRKISKMGNLAVEAYRKARAESKRSPIMLEVIGFFEHREVAEVLDKGKKVKYTVPVSGTHRSAIDVKLSSGLIIRLTVDSWVVDEIYHC